MLLGFLALLAFAPVYWLLVPVPWRQPVLIAVALSGLAWIDPRALLIVLAAAVLAYGFTRTAPGQPPRRRRLGAAAGLACLVVLFAWNKLTPHRDGLLPSQAGLAVLGLSYLVLKLAALLVEAARTPGFAVRFPDLLLWLSFLPTYPSGPIEDLDHFRGQQPVVSVARGLGAAERILFGLAKVLLGSHYLGQWLAPILTDPLAASAVELWLGMYGVAARFYLDFSGYSDIAIGLGALYGYEIEENFDWPFLRRNLVLFWQRWHMTLTRFLRVYLFVPVSRSLLRRKVPGGAAIFAGQLAAMLFCGLWHGLTWGFAFWGLTQALGLTWVGVAAPRLGRRLPAPVVRWWRTSRAGYALSTLLTLQYFSATILFAAVDLQRGVAYLLALVGEW